MISNITQCLNSHADYFVREINKGIRKVAEHRTFSTVEPFFMGVPHVIKLLDSENIKNWTKILNTSHAVCNVINIVAPLQTFFMWTHPIGLENIKDPKKVSKMVADNLLKQALPTPNAQRLANNLVLFLSDRGIMIENDQLKNGIEQDIQVYLNYVGAAIQNPKANDTRTLKGLMHVVISGLEGTDVVLNDEDKSEIKRFFSGVEDVKALSRANTLNRTDCLKHVSKAFNDAIGKTNYRTTEELKKQAQILLAENLTGKKNVDSTIVALLDDVFQSVEVEVRYSLFETLSKVTITEVCWLGAYTIAADWEMVNFAKAAANLGLNKIFTSDTFIGSLAIETFANAGSIVVGSLTLFHVFRGLDAFLRLSESYDFQDARDVQIRVSRATWDIVASYGNVALYGAVWLIGGSLTPVALGALTIAAKLNIELARAFFAPKPVSF